MKAAGRMLRARYHHRNERVERITVVANIMMTPLVAGPAAPPAPEPKNQVGGNESNFSDYMEKKVRQERATEKSMLGVQDKKRQQAKVDAQKASAERRKGQEDEPEAPQSIEQMLQQLMADLRSLLDAPENGEWKFDMRNSGLLEQLAAGAGMDAGAMQELRVQLDQGEGISLEELFSLFEQHFAEISEDMPVLAPETDIPLLETLLDRMGVSPDVLAQLSDKSIDGLGNFDLEAYLAGLEQLDKSGLQEITLSSWDVEQLRNMLQSAGASDETIEQLFPEDVPAWQEALADVRPGELDGEVVFDLKRLEDMLKQAALDVEASRPKADLVGFMQGLEDVLSQSGFDEQLVDLTPVLQKSVNEIYEQLQKMFDLARVNIEKVAEGMAEDESLTAEWLASAGKISQTIAALQNEGGLGTGEKSADDLLFPTADQADDKDSGFAMPEGLSSAHHGDGSARTGDQPQVDQRAVLPKFRFAADFNQFTASQISQGVMRGLRNNEHHLVMTMYPKELGEVKVDLHVRNNHISVSFVMENPKVKEALESNMQEFKDNLERQGYALEGIAVSVDQGDGDDPGERFETAWSELTGKMGKRNSEQVDIQGLDQAMQAADIASLHTGAISVFV